MQIELKRLQNETGITFIFVTHDQEEALTMSDRIAVMSKGKILQVGIARAIFMTGRRSALWRISSAKRISSKARLFQPPKARPRLRLMRVPRLPLRLPKVLKPSGKVTVVVRPEHASLVAASGKATLSGKLENIVYFGTDTHYHVKLNGGGEFTVRHQNSPRRRPGL